ncbi:FAD-binding oxidoreductase (plasmid) [Paroceanicella profunda]|uniref:FAD-binding oxidoreductase n=1 Tax=Paroceanicella profunda TaxID=2579971 RepID=A0A5B8G5K6_9RHOB|nr:FAD-binding oxidoreductase [Paroceanicella profunda]QDL94622.1 FAD-binding oxidoreductase [Paroceanicella profunda]
MTAADDCITRFPTLWSATAREADLSTPLAGDAVCDVAVIGAGYTGLTAAIALARAGRDVRVLDAGYPGWGGSGRNSGAVIRGFKSSRSALVKTFGKARGGAMAAFGDTVTDAVYDHVSEFGIACDLMRTGWILPAHNAAGLRRTEERQRTWSADGIGGLEMLDRAGLARRLGSQHYIGGMIDHAGASLNPLGYARGLARGALSLGAAVHGGTPVTAYREEGAGWRLDTPRGVVRARCVIVATNAYTGTLTPSVARSGVTIHTNIVATDVLSPEVARSILPGEEAVSDSRRVLYYWHKTPEGRVLFGTRGTLGGPLRERDFAHVQRAMLSVYPQLEGVGIGFRWSGRVCMTRDFLPHVDRPAEGLWTAHGYCGRGVAMATAYGRLIGETIAAGGSPADLPVPNDPAPALPRRPLKDIGITAMTQLYRALDLVT